MKTFTAIAAMVCLWLGGYFTGVKVAENRQTDPKLNLPEEFMCSVSDEPNKPDTALIYQSVSNDSLYINYLKH